MIRRFKNEINVFHSNPAIDLGQLLNQQRAQVILQPKPGEEFSCVLSSEISQKLAPVLDRGEYVMDATHSLSSNGLHLYMVVLAQEDYSGHIAFAIITENKSFRLLLHCLKAISAKLGAGYRPKIFLIEKAPEEIRALNEMKYRTRLCSFHQKQTFRRIMNGSGLLSDEQKLSVAKARATIIQGQGDKPLRLCLREQKNPFKMYLRLKERYAIPNIATLVQLQARAARLLYKCQTKPDFIADFEDVYNRLSATGNEDSEPRQVATLLASFGDSEKPPYGHVITTLQLSKAALSWQATTSRLLQAYEEKVFAATVLAAQAILELQWHYQ